MNNIPAKFFEHEQKLPKSLEMVSITRLYKVNLNYKKRKKEGKKGRQL